MQLSPSLVLPDPPGRQPVAIGFSPIPALSMVCYALGGRFLSLIGASRIRFYGWYCDLPPASPQIWIAPARGYDYLKSQPHNQVTIYMPFVFDTTASAYRPAAKK